MRLFIFYYTHTQTTIFDFMTHSSPHKIFHKTVSVNSESDLRIIRKANHVCSYLNRVPDGL